MEMKHLFIINPEAGKGRALKYIPEIQQVFAERPDEYLIAITQKPGHATEIVRKCVTKNHYRVYSVGGDGTLNEVLNGIVYSSSSLAVIPSGSGNDFIRNIYHHPSLDRILQRTVDGTEELVDLVKVNDRYFLNISSVGFDAEVAYNANQFKKIPGISGGIAYVAAVLKTLLNYRNHHLKIMIDEKHFQQKCLLSAVANGRYYGGGMIPTPDAKLNDGELDICMIKAINIAKILTFFPRFIKGRHGNMKEVDFYKGKCVKIQADHEIAMHFDGEVSRVKEVLFQIIPQGVKVVIPRSI